ncbi:MAG: DUF1232 domain-containing protein [Anaerolineaceae bacterium]|nr:DUF1232 domain-containing protein [Anaerolineaceae bacterium]
MDINMDQAKSVLENAAKQAEGILNDPSLVDNILMQLEEKLKQVPAIGETLSDLPLMIAMIKGYITKQYDQVSPKVIALMLGSFIYLVKKDDLLHDNIPVLGIADDIVIVGLALKLCNKELTDFSEWRKAQNGSTANA